jgi:restriction endonuclease S subunit
MQARQIRLSDVAEVVTGVIDEKLNDGEYQYYCYQPNSFTESSEICDLPMIIRKQPVEQRQIVRPGDVLVKRLNPSFPLLVTSSPKASVVSSNLFILRCNSEILPAYLAFLLEQPNILTQVLQLSGASAAIKAISARKLMDIIIPLHPFAKQEKIGAWWQLSKKREALLHAYQAESERFMSLIANKLLINIATEE